ncbi:MAG: F0F1 ATP synthase subunit B [Bacteroidales bacterium]|jgi:F-type H+-transporting ATPase subunit b|nr:F0F1 ATP synthase subunit B [Bacteroidales bacterium]MBP5134773.1 F0F1 ATP synthase subunit B [Paludibacteraceae bacterium]MBR6310185.1 F0F1 ATP synthase subunit B [Paludibacteraceae bacterium]MDD6357371.1 F0F1 ATP synthase subunit B [Bacteroidales bacterium]
MSLLVPETGLLFWMLLAFGVVFFVLAKYGWPVIVGMVEKRSDFINESVRVAEEAKLQLDNIKATSDAIINEARQKQMEILQQAAEMKEKMIEDAKTKAAAEAEKIIESARISIQKEKNEAMKDVRSQVVSLSLDIAEKVVRQKLSDQKEQVTLIEKLMDEVSIS